MMERLNKISKYSATLFEVSQTFKQIFSGKTNEIKTPEIHCFAEEFNEKLKKILHSGLENILQHKNHFLYCDIEQYFGDMER